VLYSAGSARASRGFCSAAECKKSNLERGEGQRDKNNPVVDHPTASCLFPDLPDEGPVISGGFPRYTAGDRVDVNCTSRRSKPAAKLRWYINDELADSVLVKQYPVQEEDHDLETSVLGLRFKVREKHFLGPGKSGDLKLKCTASIATIYWRSNEESVQGVRKQSALVSESRSSRESGSAVTHFVNAAGSLASVMHARPKWPTLVAAAAAALAYGASMAVATVWR